MPELSGPYDAYYVAPVARIKETIAVWTQNKWAYYIIEYQEPIVPGPASTIEAVVASGATSLAAQTTIAKRVVTIIQLNDLEFLHLRWKPLDMVEGILWEQPGQQKLSSRNIHSRVDPYVGEFDPTWASTTFWILGNDRDMNLEVRNPMQYATPVARFVFWGNKSLLSEFPLDKSLSSTEKAALAAGDRETVRRIVGPTVWVPAEGRSS